MYRKPIEIDAYLRVALVLIDAIDRDMERLLSFLPSGTKQPLEAEAEVLALRTLKCNELSTRSLSTIVLIGLRIQRTTCKSSKNGR
jgi:hypothetical protein